MNTQREMTPDEQEVFELFVRMRMDEVSQADRLFFADWVKKNPDNMRMYNKLERLWAELGEYVTDMDADQLWGQLSGLEQAPVASVQSKFASPKVWAIAATVVLAFAVTLFSGLFSTNPDRYQTQTAERLVINLEDGSVVHLNSRTQLEVRFGADRQIRLLNGEALFEVAHDAERKFLVQTERGLVQAIGTRFNVDATDEDIAVTVIEGTVAVTPVDAGMQITEAVELASIGEAVTLGESGAIEKSRPDTDDVVAWTRGKLVFAGEPLDWVLKRANLHSHQQIVVNDERLTQLPVYGIFNAGDSLGLLDALEAGLPVQAIEISDKLTLLSYKEL